MADIERRTLAVCAAIIAAPKLSEAGNPDQNALVIRDIIYDAILKAEKLMNQINHRYPMDRVPGES